MESIPLDTLALSYGDFYPKNIRDFPSLSVFRPRIRMFDLNSLLADTHCSDLIFVVHYRRLVFYEVYIYLWIVLSHTQ